MDGLLQETTDGQQGLITADQAHRAGLSRAAIRHRIDARRWWKAAHGVYSTRGPVLTPMQRVLAACLAHGANAAAAGRTAAHLWKLDGFDGDANVIELIRPHGSRTQFDGVRVSIVRGFEEEPMHAIDGVPVTTFPRTLLDLSRVIDESALERALDSGLRQNKWWRLWLEQQMARWGTRGRKGAATLARLLRERPMVRDSALEVQVDRLLFATSLPRPQTQYTIIENGRRIVRADFAWPAVKFALLAQDYQFHQGREAFEKDSRQMSELTATGWVYLTPTWRQIHRSPARFIEEVVATYLRAAHHTALRRSA